MHCSIKIYTICTMIENYIFAYHNDIHADCHRNSHSHCSKINGAWILFWKIIYHVSCHWLWEKQTHGYLQLISLYSFNRTRVSQNHYVKSRDRWAVCLMYWSYISYCVTFRYGDINYQIQLSTAFLTLRLFVISC